MTESNETNAERLLRRIQEILNNDNGVIRVATYKKVFEYRKKHHDMFFVGSDGNLYVKYGRNGSNCLTANKGKMLLVRIQGYLDECDN